MLIYCIVTWLISIGAAIEGDSWNNEGKALTITRILAAPIVIPLGIGGLFERLR
jgi:hypothetical protein